MSHDAMVLPPSPSALAAEVIARALAAPGNRAIPPPPPEEGLNPAAVLVPLLPTPTGWRLLFIRRASGLPTHPGQVAFPGGRRDPGDRDFRDTALRETREELGIPATAVTLLGALPPHATASSGFLIHPWVGVVDPLPPLTPAPREVAEVLTLPLAFFLEPANRVEETLRNGQREVVRPRYHHEEVVVWGATAAIVDRLVQVLQQEVH